MTNFSFESARRAAAADSGFRLGPVGRGVLVGLMCLLCVPLGFVVDITIVVMALGLCNVGVVLFLLLRKDITWGFLFYLVTVIFFQTGFWIRLPGFPDLYPARITSMLLFLIFFGQILLGMRRAPRIGTIEKAMIVFLVVMFISIVTAGQQPRWLLLMRGYIYPFMFFYFARAVVYKEEQMRIVFWFLAWLGLYFAVMGIFEKMKWYGLVYPQFIVDPNLRDQGLTRLGFRVRGIFLQPAVLGLVMTMGFFAAWHALSNFRGIVPLLLRLALALTTPATILFTQTRSVLLGFAGALMIGAWFSRNMRPMAVTLVLGGMVGVFANWDNLSSEDRESGGMGQMNTIHYRVNLAIEAFEIFLDHPFLGVGFMNLEEVAPDYRRPRDVPFLGHIDMGVGGESISHNIFITVMSEQGSLGLIPYVLIYYLMWKRTIEMWRRAPRKGLISKDFVVCIWCAYFAYLVNAMSLELRYFEYVNVLFFFLMGSMVGVGERMFQRQDEEAAAARAPDPASPTDWPGLPRTAGSYR